MNSDESALFEIRSVMDSAELLAQSSAHSSMQIVYSSKLAPR
jgi:hypothetical protein